MSNLTDAELEKIWRDNSKTTVLLALRFVSAAAYKRGVEDGRKAMEEKRDRQ